MNAQCMYGLCVIYHPLRPPSFVFRQVIIILDILFSVEFGPLRSTPVESGPTPVESGPTPVESGRTTVKSGLTPVESGRTTV